MELLCGAVESNRNLLTGLVPGSLYRSKHVTQSVLVALEVRCETALITHAAEKAFLFEHRLQRVVSLHSSAKSPRKTIEAVRYDHELLNIDI